jgi:hypothetical protein
MEPVMIRPPGPTALRGPDRRALTALIDLARLVPVADPGADVVTLELIDRPPRFAGLRAWKAEAWGITVGDGVVRLARAGLGLVTEVLDAAAERAAPVRDRLDRVPSAANALVAEGLEREPIVSQAAVALQTAAVAAAGRRPLRLAVPWPDGRRWAVAITHDLDVVEWWPAFTWLRLAELVRKGQWRLAARVGAAAARAIVTSPVQAGVGDLLAAERSRGVRSTWFVLCGTPSWRTFLAGDLTYRPEAPVTRALLQELTRDGHAVGLHGSFVTVASSTAFVEQRRRLEGLLNRQVAGVRQHFLRCDPSHTPSAMRDGGFRYDSTAGFADRNGFRLGVADILPRWKEPDGAGKGNGEPLAQAPFVWMDRALSKYRRVEDPAAWVEDALELAAACRAVQGLWVGVWHPNLVPALGYPGAPGAFVRLLDTLLSERPFVGTLDELVDWRARRAALRVDRVAADGRLALAPETAVPLEDPAR